MKPAVSSYSFSQYLNNRRLNQLQCIKKAKDLGFEGIEFTELTPDDGSSLSQYACRLKRNRSVSVCPLSALCRCKFSRKASSADLEQEIQRVQQQIDLAEILGVPLIRHDAAPSGRRSLSFEQALSIIAPACRRITEYAAKKGIRTTVENHGQFCQGGRRMEQLFNAVNHENFGILGDMGNFLCGDEAPEQAFAIIAPYLSHVHAKDFYWKSGMGPDPGEGYFATRAGNFLKGAIIGHGVVPVKQCLNIARNHGYHGFVVIEYEGAEDALEALRIGLDNLKCFLTA